MVIESHCFGFDVGCKREPVMAEFPLAVPLKCSRSDQSGRACEKTRVDAEGGKLHVKLTGSNVDAGNEREERKQQTTTDAQIRTVSLSLKLFETSDMFLGNFNQT